MAWQNQKLLCFQERENTNTKSEKPRARSCNCPMLLLFPSKKLTLNIFLSLALDLGEEAGTVLHIFLKVTKGSCF